MTTKPLPSVFIAFCPYSIKPRKYIRIDVDNWNEYIWSIDGGWRFHDNIGDSSARSDFDEADEVFELMGRDGKLA